MKQKDECYEELKKQRLKTAETLRQIKMLEQAKVERSAYADRLSSAYTKKEPKPASTGNIPVTLREPLPPRTNSRNPFGAAPGEELGNGASVPSSSAVSPHAPPRPMPPPKIEAYWVTPDPSSISSQASPSNAIPSTARSFNPYMSSTYTSPRVPATTAPVVETSASTSVLSRHPDDSTLAVLQEKLPSSPFQDWIKSPYRSEARGGLVAGPDTTKGYFATASNWYRDLLTQSSGPLYQDENVSIEMENQKKGDDQFHFVLKLTNLLEDGSLKIDLAPETRIRREYIFHFEHYVDELPGGQSRLHHGQLTMNKPFDGVTHYFIFDFSSTT